MSDRQKGILRKVFYLCFLDIDECAIKTDNCSFLAICNNTEGSFHCNCKDGLNGNGIMINCTGNNKLFFSMSEHKLIIIFLLNMLLHVYRYCEIDNDTGIFCVAFK